MRKGKVSIFPCVGGPLNGLMVTEDYAASHPETYGEYDLYNSSTRAGRISWKDKTLRKHSAILIHKSIYEYRR